MAHHAFFVTGDIEEGIKSALAYGERVLTLSGVNNPDIIILRHSLFSVEEARKVYDITHRMSVRGSMRLIILSATRLFHEAQNALLKVFEEPPEGTCLVLVVHSQGNIIPTLRSRLLELPHFEDHIQHPMSDVYSGGDVQAFLAAGKEERVKIVAKILERAKSDKQEEKQAARAQALRFAENLMRVVYTTRTSIRDSSSKPHESNAQRLHVHELDAFLSDLDHFIPILHERSAPLKLIFEHLLLTIPKVLGRA